jgi:hypothetical protein
VKSRILWTLAVVVAIALGYAIMRVGSPQRHPEVAIQDGKTIDFSSGRAVVKDSAKEKAAIDKAVKEMEEASKAVSFSSPAQPPVAPKKAETKK